MQAPATVNATAHIYQGLLWYSFPALDVYADRLVHGFSSRIGGVSEGGLASLNLGLGRGDDPNQVKENYRRFGIAAGFDPDQAVFSWQGHGVALREATKEDAGKGLLYARDYYDIDGLFTREEKLPLITHYADCTPLYFYAPDLHIAATSHAGWRGTAQKMAAVTVHKLASMGCDPTKLIAVIGPSAGPERYEVDNDCAASFMGIGDEEGPVLRPVPDIEGKYLLDIWRANRIALLEAGMQASNISIAGICTITFSDFFYSHRVQGNDRGALAGFIMLK